VEGVGGVHKPSDVDDAAKGGRVMGGVAVGRGGRRARGHREAWKSL
jgi:hypothetical protein